MKANVLEVDDIDGFSMLINKNSFKEENYFDENFFLYLENNDLCLRVKKKNQKIYLILNSFIDHKGGASSDPNFSSKIECLKNWHWMWSKFYYNKKHKGIIISILFGLSSLMGNFFKYLICILTLNKKKNIYKMRMSGLLNAILGKQSWFRPEIN